MKTIYKDMDGNILNDGDRMQWINSDGTVNLWCEQFPYERGFHSWIGEDAPYGHIRNSAYIAWGDGECMPYSNGCELSKCVRKKVSE